MATTAPANRTWTDATLDAIPDALAALACGLAWKAPDALGFDLLDYAAPLFFIELPLATSSLPTAGAYRVSSRCASEARSDPVAAYCTSAA